MARLCPVCGQPLPQALDEHELQHRIQKLMSPVIAGEKQKLEKEYEQRVFNEREAARREAERSLKDKILEQKNRADALAAEKQKLEQQHQQQLATERESGRREAERSLRTEMLQLRQRAERAELDRSREVERARREAEKAAERNVANAVRLATQQNEAKLEKMEAARGKDRLRYEADRARLQTQLDTLSRKLEKQTGEQLGEEGEADLLSQLRGSFPGDRIERVGRGTKGADMVQHVMEEGKELGRIVYESKNVSAWQNSFITQAKRYQTQYDSPNIMIVTRTFPRKQKGLCVVKDIPVVEPRMAVPLAVIIREGIVEIAKLRLTQVAREGKAQDLFEYILSDKFATRFREIADSVSTLRELQQKERDWHENTWANEAKLHDKIDARRREIDVQINTITRSAGVRAIPIRRMVSA